MKNLKLFLVLMGGRQKDDRIEAHNFFAGVGESIEALLPQMKKAWSGLTHVDGYMHLEQVDGYKVVVSEAGNQSISKNIYPRLMVYNIGYYKAGQFAEFHKLIPMVLRSETDPWKQRLKQDPDFAQGQLLDEIARSHVDDKFSISATVFDVDDAIDIQHEVPNYKIELVALTNEPVKENELKLGYLFVKELKGIK